MKFVKASVVAMDLITKWHKERVKEWEKSDFKDEIEMPILMDSIEVWRIVKNKPELQHKLSEVEEMCLDSLKSYWGDEAKIQFNNDLSVKCYTSDGRLLTFDYIAEM